MSIITLTGSLGSGKSTIGQILSKELGYEYISGGMIFREIAKEQGLTVVDINLMADEDKELDYKVDNYLKSLNDRDNIIVDSRLAWFFIKDSLKIYLHTNIETAVERISKSDRETEGNLKDKDELTKRLVSRRQSEINRFKNLYEVNLEDFNNYNLVIDTSNSEPKEIVEKILQYVTNFNY